MEISFSNKDLKDICEKEKIAKKKIGNLSAKKLKIRLADLMAVNVVSEIIAGNPGEITMINKNEFNPDWISPPGDTISELLEERGWSKTEFAERMGYTKKHISQLLAGKAPVNEETARKLELVLGGKIGFWLNRESQYREGLSKVLIHTSYDVFKEILNELPIKDMIQFGWIGKKDSISEQVQECLKFFGVSSYSSWDVSYKKSILAFRSSEKLDKQSGSIAAWLRVGEQIAEKKDLVKYNAKLLKKKLLNLMQLTTEKESSIFLPKIQSILEECGIVYVVSPTPKGCPVSGLTKWISKDNVLVMQGFRYKSNDHFWFTLFHEIGHILYHRKKMIYLELDNQINSEEEKEADQFASELLIPPADFEILKNITLDESNILKFSEENEISPGIVVGRLQKEGLLPWGSKLNSLKVYYEWG